MSRQILASFRPPSRRRIPRSLPPWIGKTLLVAGFGAIAYLLWWAPSAWSTARREELYRAWIESVREEPVLVGGLFTEHPEASKAFPSEPMEVRGLLEAHPILEAAVRRGAFPEVWEVWIRNGSRMVLDAGTPLGERYRTWAKQAEAAGAPQWHPPAGLDPEARSTPTVVLLGPRWIWIKRWKPGSPQVEGHLRRALGPHSKVRVCVWRLQPQERGTCDSTSPMLRPPNLQTCPDSAEGIWNSGYVDTVLGPDWEMGFQPWPAEAGAWSAKVANTTRLSRLAALGIAASLALGLGLQRSARKREALAAERLATLTHGLKTPLALHKLRCDTLRMGRLGPAQAAEELMKLGQDVDDLTLLIEQGLSSHQGGPTAQGSVDQAWFEDIAEDLRPAFEAGGRHLEAQLVPELGSAHLPSLRFALQTLLENAYEHGAGTARLHTWKEGRLLHIRISDEGPGLDATALAGLVQPSRKRDGSRPGRGLGLSLLTQMARQEGWGLELENLQEGGLGVILRIPDSSNEWHLYLWPIRPIWS